MLSEESRTPGGKEGRGKEKKEKRSNIEQKKSIIQKQHKV